MPGILITVCACVHRIGSKSRFSTHMDAGVATWGPLTQILIWSNVPNLYDTDDTNLCKSSFVRIKE